MRRLFAFPLTFHDLITTRPGLWLHPAFLPNLRGLFYHQGVDPVAKKKKRGGLTHSSCLEITEVGIWLCPMFLPTPFSLAIKVQIQQTWKRGGPHGSCLETTEVGIWLCPSSSVSSCNQGADPVTWKGRGVSPMVLT